MDKDEFFRDKEREARIGVEKARVYFLSNPLQVVSPGEIVKNILLGMKFQVTSINYVTNTVTFTLVE